MAEEVTSAIFIWTQRMGAFIRAVEIANSFLTTPSGPVSMRENAGFFPFQGVWFPFLLLPRDS